MTTLPEEGFLADEVVGVVEAVRVKYASWLAEICAVNRLRVRSQYELRVDMRSAQQVTCAALYPLVGARPRSGVVA